MTDPSAPETPAADVAPAPQHAPNGWYPTGDGRMRWWNETGWTDNYTPAPVARVPKVRRKIPLIAAVWTAVGVLVLGILIGSGAHGSTPAAVKTDTSGLRDQITSLEADKQSLQGQIDAFASEKEQVDAEKAKLDAAGAKAASNTIPGDGEYLVGADIKPGTYRSTGNDNCYWERARSADGGDNAIIANDIVNGQAIVTIRSTDKLFTSTSCSDWHKIG